MKKLILASTAIIVILIISLINYQKEVKPFRHKCSDPNMPGDYSKVHIPISFISGQEKCLYHKGKFFDSYYYRDLKEFTITKNNKYCLWNSRYWDKECQDSAMEYAYGDYYDNEPEASKNYQTFKNILIDFIKYVQANDIEKALTLTHEEAMFFTDDKANCLIQEKNGFDGHCRAYFKKNSEYRGRKGKINLEIFRENLMQIDVDNIRFYLADLTNRYIYSVVVPYEYQGNRKYFDIRFKFGIGGGGPAYPYDNGCSPKIYDLGINSTLPEGH